MVFRLKEREPVPQKVLRFIHLRLDSLELGVASIERQALEALKASLKRIDAYLKHPPSLRSLRVRQSESQGYCFSYAGLTLSFDAVVRPILLNRRSLIVGRLEALKLDDGIQSLSESLQGGNDEVSQLRLTNKLQGLRASSQTLEEQLIESSKEQEQLRIQVEKEKLKLLEGRFKIALSLLQKDAAATLIGVVFITMASLTLLVAMVMKTPVPFELQDLLLLVFGYFFGHATHPSSPAE
ncbi:MAG: hypothetical protein AAFQ89_02745 [Cyanobacteria bacterium J06626_18]